MVQDVQEDAQSLVGQVLADTYKLEQLLATGGMGAVYRGVHLRTGGHCAVKVLHKGAVADPEIYRRFLDEARIISALRHPYIVHVTDLNHANDGTPFIAMELLIGEDLEDRLIHKTRLPLKQVLRMARQIGTAMQAAHDQGVVHRDLKPTNIFLARHRLGKSVVEIVKIIDFGVSKIPRPEGRATRNLLVLGTPKYVAPEGAQGHNTEMDGRADQFSLAVILYRCLSGHLPFEQGPGETVIDLLRKVCVENPPPLSELVPGLPRHVVVAIERAMSKDKEGRFPTMMDFVQALEGGGPGAPLHPGGRATLTGMHALDTTAQFHNPVRWSRVIPAGAAGVLLGLCALFGVNRLLLRPPLGSTGAASLGAGSTGTSGTGSTGATTGADPAAGDPLQRSFTDAIGRGDLTAALRLWQGLPEQSPLRQTLLPQAEDARRALLSTHLKAADAARRDGKCRDARQHARLALEVSRHERPALNALWADCGETAGRPSTKPYPLTGYPPLRTSIFDTAPPPGAPGADQDEILGKAQLAYADGRFLQVLELAHLVVFTDNLNYMRAYRLIGVGACALGKARLARLTYDRLDAPSRELLTELCQLHKLTLP